MGPGDERFIPGQQLRVLQGKLGYFYGQLDGAALIHVQNLISVIQGLVKDSDEPLLSVGTSLCTSSSVSNALCEKMLIGSIERRF